MKQYDVYGIGNALVDTEYEVDEAFLATAGLTKGIMTLIEEAERERLIKLLEVEHEHQVIKQAGGGSAANSMVAVAQLGGSSYYSCKVANDVVGDFFMKDLAAVGVDTNLDTGRSDGFSGQCISMVTPDAERTMTTHLGISAELASSELNEEALANSQYLYIEGYLVTSPNALIAARRAQQIARKNGVKVSLTLSDPAIIEHFKAAFDQFAEDGVDLVFCNEEEAMIWTGSRSPEEAFEKLKTVCTQVVMTRGKDGAMTWDGAKDALVTGVPAQAVDTTGAGDVFAGAFLYKLTQGANFVEAAMLANRVASALVSQFGARLPQDTIVGLK